MCAHTCFLNVPGVCMDVRSCLMCALCVLCFLGVACVLSVPVFVCVCLCCLLVARLARVNPATLYASRLRSTAF